MDAGQLIRNLYLVVQLIEARVPVVIALNMIDEVVENPPSAEAISDLLGVPCVPTSARRGLGVEQLRRVVANTLATPNPATFASSIPTPCDGMWIGSPTRSPSAGDATSSEIAPWRSGR